MHDQIPPRNRAERRAASRGRTRRATGAALTAGSAALALTAGVLGSSPAAHAAGTYTVTQANDDGTGGTNGSLSWAIAQANGDPGSTVDFTVPGGSISIDGTMPHITAAVTITGPGATALTINGNDAHRIFYIEPSANSVTISGVTLANGHVDAGSNDGGAILSRSGLTLSASVVTGSFAASDGGGLYFGGNAPLNVSDSTFSGNSTMYDDGGAMAINGYQGPSSVSITNATFSANVAGGAGGALYIATDNVPTTISGSTFTGNHSGHFPGAGSHNAGAGGAIFDQDGSNLHTLTITKSTISGNVAEQYGGGGLQMYAASGGGTAVIHDSVITDNSAELSGGGLYFYGVGSVDILRTTISGNTASLNPQGTGGGGVFVGSALSLLPRSGNGEVNIGESTISGNSAASGGGLWFYSDAPVHVFNSTISGNTASQDGGGVTALYVNGLYLTQDTITANTASSVGGVDFAGDSSPAATSHRATRAQKGGAANTNDHNGDSKNASVRSLRAQRVRAQGGVFEVGATSTILSANSGDDVGGVPATAHSNHSLLGTNGAVITVDDQGGTIRSSTPTLGPLQDNGGPTQTHELLAGSAAIDAGLMPVPSFTGNEFDQRGDGFARVVNGTVDIGAFEVQPEAAAPIVITPKFTG